MQTDRPIQFRRIGWQQTRDIINLSRSLLPLDLCRKTHSLFALLVNLERRNHNLSFGLYSGDEMVGYMLVYFHDRSLYHNRDELIVHIDEYCVAADYRGRGRDVIGQMFREFDLWKPRCGIEAIATGDALQHWLGIGRIVAHWNYETNLRENDCVRGGHQMGRLRWENKADEAWKLSTPSKLPKAHTLDGKGLSDVEIVCVRNQRQLLSLRADFIRLAELQQEGKGIDKFERLWQWWRFYGLEEEMNVLVVKKAEQIIAISPLSWKHTPYQKEKLTLSLIGSVSAQGPATAVVDKKHRPLAQSALLAYFKQQTAAGDIRYEDSQPHVTGLDGSAENSSQLELASEVKGPTGFSWFGLKRREIELHKAYLMALDTSDGSSSNQLNGAATCDINIAANQ